MEIPCTKMMIPHVKVSANLVVTKFFCHCTLTSLVLGLNASFVSI